MARTAAMKAENDWEAESDLRTLIEAEKIKADKQRLKRAMAKRKELQTALGKMAQK